ncbi:DUF1223 domain-containing protein [Loktanella sp. SALINAS62]|uniref:DUF1223 domain-containing protein n=1 Tax=Loktanella sp. SALINAS62 TaxID=2706124 RepID=UPI001B8B8DC9|nr:DUF1223 domain-containing protein [Loktanella sp. SALINAS62]MBS1303519.1 DUF1223 domain-containing protein [Loktanella sp. SALINAS62]
MRHTLAVLACSIGFAGAATAQHTGTVVELYTSQGCSSCPPADHLLAQLADHDGVIALALHVDYWDYIGWADDLAQPAFTDRQRGYAHKWNAPNLYTPQMVIAGTEDVVGSDTADVMMHLARHQATPYPVVVDAVWRGDGLFIAAHAEGAVPDRATVQIVTLEPSVTRDITRGENAGKTIEYRNVVTDWTVAGDWMTADALDMSVPLERAGPIVVIVQDGTDGPILGAVKLP